MAGNFAAGLAGIVLMACGGCAAAGLPDPGPADVAAMTRVFDRFCLQAFPDDAAVDRLAAAERARPLTPDQVRAYLHADPGRGWTLSAPDATYAITIEHPPVRACAVRRMTPSGFPTVQPYLRAIQDYAAARGDRLVLAGRQASRTAAGADITAFMHALVAPGATAPSEDFIMLLTDYHGRYVGDLSADVGRDAVGVEVRFVHQMPPHP